MLDCIGYANPLYALSLKEFGEPRELTHCGGWILIRQIAGTGCRDAMGCYPVFACRDWERLHEDLQELGPEVVSLVLVTDPFCGVPPAYLEGCFDIVKPFKKHYIANLTYPLEDFVHKIHRYNVRKSLRLMEVEVCLEPIKYLGEWLTLYRYLIEKHNIQGIGAFSPKSFEGQLQLPGMVMAIGRKDGEVVGAELTLVQGDKAYGHLAAFSPLGYRIKASYGIIWTMLKHLQSIGVGVYDIGGAAGIKEDANNGLATFKRGWSNGQCLVYLCGRVFDRQQYESICRERQAIDGDYFPAYRAPGLNITSFTGSKLPDYTTAQ